MNFLRFFDSLHPGPTWRPWRTFAAAVHGFPLDDAGLALFRQCTGRMHPRPGGYPEAVCVVGVQSGKSSVAGTFAVHAALMGSKGTHALLVAQDQRSSLRALLGYVREPFESNAAFRAELVRETTDALELRNGTTIAAYPCRPQGLRGLRACVVVVDELAFFTASDGRPTDTEMLRVARGRLATTAGKLIVISSPYGQSGALWDLHRRHWGRDDSPVLVWQADAPTMNPTLSDDYLVRMAEEDPEAYQSEVLGQFRAGLSSLLDPDALDAVIAEGIRERAPSGVEYVAHFDPSGGRRDAAALSIAHRDGANAVQDLLRAWPAPHNPAGVIYEAAQILRTYGVRKVQLDRFAGEFPSEQFRSHGIEPSISQRSTSDTYLELLPLVLSGRSILLDDPHLLRELRGLERKTGSGGHDRVDHRPGSHDDRAAATSGALVLAVARVEQRPSQITFGTRPSLSRIGGAALNRPRHRSPLVTVDDDPAPRGEEIVATGIPQRRADGSVRKPTWELTRAQLDERGVLAGDLRMSRAIVEKFDELNRSR